MRGPLNRGHLIIPMSAASVKLLTAQHTKTTCVPGFFCPRSRKTSVVVCRALGLCVQQKVLEI